MLKRLAAALLVTLMCVGVAQAHTLFMSMDDNEDGTVTVEGIYSTGAEAARTEVRLEDAASGKVLFKGKTDENGSLTFKKPGVAYVVIMDGGPGHTVTEDGPQ